MLFKSVAGLVYNENHPSTTISIGSGEEVDTGISGRGVYFLTSSSSGYSAVFISSYAGTNNFVLTRNNLGFSAIESDSNIIVISQTNGGNIIIKNKYESGSARKISIRKIGKL